MQIQNSKLPPAGKASSGGEPVRAVSPDRFREWVRAAQAQSRVPLGSGHSQREACGRDLFNLVTGLIGLGYITTHATRDPVTRELVYIAVRTKQPIFKSTRL